MFPSKESWEELGFQFKDIDDDILYEATLPIGWSLKPSDNPMGTEIYDQNGFLELLCLIKVLLMIEEQV